MRRSGSLVFLVTFYSVIPAMPWASDESRGSDLRSQSSDVSTARKILEELPDREPEETTLDERSSKQAGVRRLPVAVCLRMPPTSA